MRHISGSPVRFPRTPEIGNCQLGLCGKAASQPRYSVYCIGVRNCTCDRTTWERWQLLSCFHFPANHPSTLVPLGLPQRSPFQEAVC